MKCSSLGRALDSFIQTPIQIQKIKSTIHEFSRACSEQRVTRVVVQGTRDGYVVNYQVRSESLQFWTVNEDGRPWLNLNDLVQFLKDQRLQLPKITLDLHF